MSSKPEKNELLPEQEEIYKTANAVNAQIEVLETFIARRFDEISMEINATAQQADMAEDSIIQRFSEVLEVLSAINHSGGGNTAANTGVELEAIIEETENAANTILDASDRIADCVGDDAKWEDEKGRKEIRESISNDIQNILMACSFQDLTSQRIRNTLDNLSGIEDRLNTTFEKLGIDVKPDQEVVKEQVKEASSQDDIDSLFD